MENLKIYLVNGRLLNLNKLGLNCIFCFFFLEKMLENGNDFLSYV